MLDIHKILESLPHRYPFLLVDRILEVEAERVVGIKNVTINEPFFQGHFPNEPVMPGVLVLEAMGQVGSVMVANNLTDKSLVAFLTSIESAKFRKPVRPGDQLRTEATLIKYRRPMGKVRTVATVDGEIVAEAIMGFVISKNLRGNKESDGNEI